MTVDYAITGGTATGGGVDYTLASGTLTFVPGVTSQNISVTVMNDTTPADVPKAGFVLSTGRWH